MNQENLKSEILANANALSVLFADKINSIVEEAGYYTNSTSASLIENMKRDIKNELNFICIQSQKINVSIIQLPEVKKNFDKDLSKIQKKIEGLNAEMFQIKSV